jgi:hypothetical protein
MIRKLFKRWKEIKALINADEYFLVVANQKSNIEPWRGPIEYDYIKNTDREVFYKFVKDYIKNNYE